MRRCVKENLLTFEGKRLFPERGATTVNYDLSPDEQRLYEAVTDYVQDGMNRAQAIRRAATSRRGLIVGFALAALQRRLASSPEAIYQSLRRRTEKLDDAARSSCTTSAGELADPVADLPKGIGSPTSRTSTSTTSTTTSSNSSRTK